MVNAESVETQRKGMVVVTWGIGNKSSRRTMSASTYWNVSAVQRSLPVKVVGLHFCYDSIILRPIVSTMQLGCDFFTGVRFRSHYGGSHCCHYDVTILKEAVRFLTLLPMVLFF